MADEKVLGSSIVFQIDPAGGTAYGLVMCLENQSISITNDEIDAATKCGPDTSIGKQKQSVSFDGQIILAPSGTHVGAAILFDLVQDKTLFSWKYGPASPAAGDITYTGEGYLSEFTQTAPNEGNVTFSCKVAPSGTITQTVAS